MRKLVGVLLLLSLTTALLSGGRELVGRLLLSAGMPGNAAELLQDPAWKCVAFYSAQRWNEAAEAFSTSGAPQSAYNLGNALAQGHRYAEALAAYDKALEQDPEDDDARSNRTKVAALLWAGQTHASERIHGSAGSLATKQRDKDDTGAPGQDGPLTGAEGMAGRHEVASNSGSAGGALKRASTMAVHSFAAIHGPSMGSGTNDGGIGQGDVERRTLLEDSFRMGKPIEAKSVQADRQWLKTLPDDPGKFLKLRLAAEHKRRVEAGTAPPITGDPW